MFIIIVMAFFDHFNLLAPIYDRVIKPADPEKMRLLAGLPVRGRLLDVGGGTGRSSIALKNDCSTLVIADSSLGMLEQAQKKDGLHTVCSTSEDLSFSDASFERVIMVDALHHVYDYRLTLKELWRVTMPGGRIVIQEPDIRSWSTKFIAFAEKLALMRSHFISPLTIVRSFHYPDATTGLENDGPTCWIIIDKLIGSGADERSDLS